MLLPPLTFAPAAENLAPISRTRRAMLVYPVLCDDRLRERRSRDASCGRVASPADSRRPGGLVP